MNISSHAHRRAATSAKSLVSSLIASHLAATTHPSSLSWQHIHATTPTLNPSTETPFNCHVLAQPGHAAVQSPSGAHVPPAVSARRNARLSPRNFMLACRAGSRSARVPTLLSSPLRHSSNAATASSVAPEETANEHTELDSSPWTESASSRQAHDNVSYVELVMPSSTSLDRGSNGLDFETATSDRILRIDGRIAACEVPIKKVEAIKDAKERRGLITHDVDGDLTWDHILKYLEDRTQTRGLDYRYITIEGPETQLAELYYYLLHNPGHNVDVDYPKLVSGRGTGCMTIKGHPHALERTMNYIQKQKLQGIIFPYTRDVATGERILDMRAHPEAQGMGQNYRVNLIRFVAPSRRPEDVPAPLIWTMSSLAQYVENIANARSPEVLRARENAQRHRETVLLDLLRSTEVRPVLSYAAFHHVFSFLLRHERYNQAWALIELMKSLDLHPGTAFYNVMLLNAAMHQDIGAFDRLLVTMRTEQLRPDAGTWVSLLMASSNIDFKQTVMRKMFDNGLSRHAVFETQTAPIIIPYSLQPFLSTGGNVDEFLEILDECWGSKWVTDEAVCHIVDVLCSRGTFLEAVHLVSKIAREREHRISKAPLHVLLSHCRRTGSVDLAVWVINHAAQKWRISVKDRIIFAVMFKAAYHAQMHNLVRVVWQYASATGHLSNFMRSKVYNSLHARCLPDKDTVNGRWMSSFGALACNIDPVAASLSPDEIMDQQRAQFETAKPKSSFASKLVEALFLDKDWTAQQVKKTRGTTWKMMNAVTIDMRPHVRHTSTALSIEAPPRLSPSRRRRLQIQRASRSRTTSRQS